MEVTAKFATVNKLRAAATRHRFDVDAPSRRTIERCLAVRTDDTERETTLGPSSIPLLRMHLAGHGTFRRGPQHPETRRLDPETPQAVIEAISLGPDEAGGKRQLLLNLLEGAV